MSPAFLLSAGLLVWIADGRDLSGAEGLIGAAAAHSSPGQAAEHCRSKVGVPQDVSEFVGV